MKLVETFDNVMGFVRPSGATRALGRASVPLLDLMPQRAADCAIGADTSPTGRLAVRR